MRAINSILVFSCLALGLCAISACGVKGPPLPPISATPKTPEEKSLGRKPTPIRPSPSPVSGG